MVLYNMPSKSYIFVDSLPIACDNNHMQNTYIFYLQQKSEIYLKFDVFTF